MQQEAAAKDDVEGPQGLGREVVDTADNVLHAGAPESMGGVEPCAYLRLRLVTERFPDPGQQVDITSSLDICGNDPVRAAALHLEGPKAIGGPDVESGLALERRGQTVPVHDRA